MPDVELITTSDGSHSLLNTTLNETYHSTHGALQESRHVFIQNGLEYFGLPRETSAIKILEIGFGTGLNALLALQYALDSNVSIHYTALEPHPVDDSILTRLNYPALVNNGTAVARFKFLHSAGWDREEQVHPNFTLSKKMIRVQDWRPAQEQFDVIFFDAFAPVKQPEMWELSVLKKIGDWMSNHAVFVTYCAKGQLKRDLKSIGLQVETLPGAPGKKEMVRATKS